jgi:tetratricopeptide (TPR) repeat protein
LEGAANDAGAIEAVQSGVLPNNQNDLAQLGRAVESNRLAALEYDAAGDHAAAATQYEAAAQVDADRAKVATGAEKHDFALQNWDEAVEDWKKAAAQQDLAGNHHAAGDDFNKAHQYKDAAEQYEKAGEWENAARAWESEAEYFEEGAKKAQEPADKERFEKLAKDRRDKAKKDRDRIPSRPKDPEAALPGPGSFTSRVPVKAVLAGLLAAVALSAAGFGVYKAVGAGSSSGPVHSQAQAPTSINATAINCDCFNTPAPNIGGAAVRQCLKGERTLMAKAARGELRIDVVDGKITGPAENMCDLVAAGPDAWPYRGKPASAPQSGGPAPPPCTDPVDPNERCIPSG